MIAGTALTVVALIATTSPAPLVRAEVTEPPSGDRDDAGLIGFVAECRVALGRDATWALLVDVERYPRIFPGVTRVDVKERKDNGLIADWVESFAGLEMKAPVEVTFDDEKRTLVTRSLGETKNDARFVVDTDPKDAAASRVAMAMTADPGVWLPAFVRARIARAMAEDTCDALAKEAAARAASSSSAASTRGGTP